jgi:hypothetical protein
MSKTHLMLKGMTMSHLFFCILTCLLGWASLHATSTPLEASQSALRIEKPVGVPIEQPFAFVYNDNAKEKVSRNRYYVETPIIFNSQGPSKQIAYDSKTGELIVSEPGNYEVIYSALTYFNSLMFLEVNGEKVNSTSVGVQERINTPAVFVLKLAKGDRIGLAFNVGLLDRSKGVGNSASLSMKKL